MLHGEEQTVAYLEWLGAVRETSPATLERYARLLRAYLEWCDERGLDVLTMTDEELVKFAARPLVTTGRSRSPATRQVERSILKNFYDWLNRTRRTDIADPTLWLPQPRLKNVNPQPLPEDLWIRVWSSDLAPRWRFTLGAAYFLGLRPTEITKLSSDQLKPHLIYNMWGKGDSVTHYPWMLVMEILGEFKPQLQPALFTEAYMYVRNKYEYPCPWRDPKIAYLRLVSRCRREFGIPKGDITFRKMRSSAATNLLECGMDKADIQLLVRHVNVTTIERYARNSAHNIRQWFRREMERYAET